MKPTPDPSKAPGSKPQSKPDPKDDLKTLPMAEVEKKLQSSPEGLTVAEAQKRLTQYGPNELTKKKTNLFLKFLSYFWGPIPWMIEIAVILLGRGAPLAGYRNCLASYPLGMGSSGSGERS